MNRSARTVLVTMALVGIAVGTAITASRAQTGAGQAQDVWKSFRFFIGRWEGQGEGQGGVSRGKQEWAFVLRDRFLSVRNEAVFDPQEKNPKGERHEDMGVISFDQTRKVYVFRQFHVEGFVNQYVSPGPEADGKTFIFVSEQIENIPSGYKARLTYRIVNENEFEQTFDLAEPGKEFACYSKGIMKRVSRDSHQCPSPDCADF